MKFGTWNFGNLNGPGSLTGLARELAWYKLGLVGVQGVRWDVKGTVRADDHNFFYGKESENH